MKQLILVLGMTLLAASASPTDDGLRVRYDDTSGRMSLTVSHDIEVRAEHPVKASRDFSFDLALAVDREAAAVTVTVERATATYMAHGLSGHRPPRPGPSLSAPGRQSEILFRLPLLLSPRRRQRRLQSSLTQPHTPASRRIIKSSGVSIGGTQP